jgi:hypothetical protein
MIKKLAKTRVKARLLFEECCLKRGKLIYIIGREF